MPRPVIPFFALLAPFLFSITGVASPQAGSAETAYRQALQLLQSGKNSDALAVINAAIAAGSGDVSLYNLRGLVTSELGRNQEAEESFRTVIRLSPTSPM